MSRIVTTIEKITPKIARQMLLNNPSNRRMDQNEIGKMARDMIAGRWQFNGDSIRFDENDALIDGQHRLKAIIQTEVSIKSIVLRGLPNEVRETIDSGAKRTVAARFQMAGIRNAVGTSAAISVMYQIARKNIGPIPTSGEASEILVKHPHFSESVSLCLNSFPHLGSRLAAMNYIGRYLGERMRADSFVDVWRTGAPCYQGDPAHAAREKIIKTRGTINTLSVRTQARVVLHSFNLFMARKSVKIIQIPGHYSVKGWDIDDLFNPTMRGLEAAAHNSAQ